ncbi:MAG: PQQ-binding-like beta-propeller repeat protein [Lachnospiraceae bacterium]|nr:PQQ-binding-like beta-propeller repeat protein [Lachnospiraceae bacterium]
MEKVKYLVRKYKRGLIVSAVIIAAVIIAFIGFKLLVKVGNPKYFYNYLHDAGGSLEAEYYPEYEAGADAEVPYSTEATSPDAHGVTEIVCVRDENGNPKIVTSYERADKISFSKEFVTGDLQKNGILTFRGNYARTKTSVGRSQITEAKLEKSWDYSTGKILKSNGVDYWSGNGWTGQPILMKWDKDVKQTMNMYDSAKNKDDLVEVIYPGMDGSIRFLDLETGEETRPVIYVGMTFKGTASLHPEGIPMLICGSGDAQTGMFGENVSQRFYIYSLIDGSLLYQGGYDSEIAPRIWHAYDSSPIIDPATDTLIQPGENGVIYTMKLGTQYDRASGKLSINPSDFAEYSFSIEGKYKEGGYLWGSECSAAVYQGYLFIGDNAGTFYCLDLNKMQMVWVQELNEDINSSPILDLDGDSKYVYVATTLKYNYDKHSMGDACIYKLNAMNGEIVWKKPYNVHTVKGYAGGVLSTGALGQGRISDHIIYSVSKTPGLEEGYLVALNRKDGKEAWRIGLDMYSWSSTVITYADDQSPYIIQGCQNGDLLLIDATSGIIKSRLNYGSAIEATPVVYENNIVLATRSEKIFGVKIK